MYWIRDKQTNLFGPIAMLLLWISCVLAIVGMECDVDVSIFWAINFIWLSNLCYSMAKYSKRYIFLVINLTYFLFYIGRITMNYLFEGNFALKFSQETILETMGVIFSGLLFLRFFSSVFEHVRRNRELIATSNQGDIELIRRLAKMFYWGTYIFAFAVIAERVIFVQAMGYVDFYASYSSRMPGIVSRLASVNEVMFFIFLASAPKKKETRLVIFAFLFLGVLSLGYGQRNPLAVKFLFIFMIYIPLREARSDEEDGEQWITRTYKTFLLISIPAMVLLLAMWKFHRQDLSFEGGLGDLVIDFFDTEGNSAYIIGLAIENIKEFPDKFIIYTLEPIHEFLTNNFIYKMLFGAKSALIYENSVYAAMNSWDIGKPLSYFANPVAYANGVGTGSCYLVEVFVDFGYMGVALISMLYSYIINFVQRGTKCSWIVSTIMLLSVYEIMYAPRDLALSFVGKFFSFTFIAIAIVMYAIYRYIVSRREDL
ncbi:MAG: O-antigen polysaccharide polymerase Wzy family protein [Eubacteriales bacterium]|nr:O-antigen polysaccharide polymerase Wzy family protein [Eubacteriales bacterium]